LQQTKEVCYRIPYSLEDGKEERKKDDKNSQEEFKKGNSHTLRPVTLDNDGNKENIMSGKVNFCLLLK
jgi:hypothetical protein